MIRKQLPKEALVSFYKNFEVEYTHNSTAIEGNTLSLIQTKAVLEDGISIGGKTLREIYEVVNHHLGRTKLAFETDYSFWYRWFGSAFFVLKREDCRWALQGKSQFS